MKRVNFEVDNYMPVDDDAIEIVKGLTDAYWDKRKHDPETDHFKAVYTFCLSKEADQMEISEIQQLTNDDQRRIQVQAIFAAQLMMYIFHGRQILLPDEHVHTAIMHTKLDRITYADLNFFDVSVYVAMHTPATIEVSTSDGKTATFLLDGVLFFAQPKFLTFSFLGKSMMHDAPGRYVDNYFSMGGDVDSNWSLKQLIKYFINHENIPAELSDVLQYVLSFVFFFANHKDLIETVIDQEYIDILKSVANKKSSKKIKKARRKMQRINDHKIINVKPAQSVYQKFRDHSQQTKANATGSGAANGRDGVKHRRMHLVHGFSKRQRFGRKYEKIKWVYIEPYWRGHITDVTKTTVKKLR